MEFKCAIICNGDCRYEYLLIENVWYFLYDVGQDALADGRPQFTNINICSVYMKNPNINGFYAENKSTLVSI